MLQTENSASTHQAIDRALELIAILSSGSGPMNVVEISRALGITRATAYGMVNSLLTQNYLERNPASKRYSLGYRFYQIGSQYRYQFSFLNTAEGFLGAMLEKWNAVRINISVLKPEMMEVILLSRDSSLAPPISHGQVIPAQCSAGGKVLLAYLDPALVDRWLGNATKLPALTPNTITDKERLDDELAEIRCRGFSVEREELSLRRACVGAPIRDMSGKTIASASFVTTLQYFQQNGDQLIDDIVLLTNDISVALGYNLLGRVE